MKLAHLKRRFIKMEMPAKTLFTNANLVLEGLAELQKSFDVLVQGNRILSVSQTPMDHEDANVIDISGRTLMPGLIDAHAHITGLSLSPKNISYPASEIAIAAANYLQCSLDGRFHLHQRSGRRRPQRRTSSG